MEERGSIATASNVRFEAKCNPLLPIEVLLSQDGPRRIEDVSHWHIPPNRIIGWNISDVIRRDGNFNGNALIDGLEMKLRHLRHISLV